MNIPKPLEGDFSSYIKTYIDLVGSDDTYNTLVENQQKMNRLFQKLTTEQQAFRYAEGKWNAKEILLHLIDSERVFLHRAFTFIREEGSEQPGFEQDDYVQQSAANDRSMPSLLNEYNALRQNTLAFAEGINAEMWHRTGKANGSRISASALFVGIAGHEIHHYNIYKKRYL